MKKLCKICNKKERYREGSGICWNCLYKKDKAILPKIINLKNEIWKNIKNFTGYKVSNLGRIKSLKRTINRKDGTILRIQERIRA